MKAFDTLTFEVSPEQQAVLDGLRGDGQVAGPGLEMSYRAWNAAFTPCDAPLEASYRAWNAAFVACDAPIEHDS